MATRTLLSPRRIPPLHHLRRRCIHSTPPIHPTPAPLHTATSNNYTSPLKWSHLLAIIPISAIIAGGIVYFTELKPAIARQQELANNGRLSNVKKRVNLPEPSSNSVIESSTGLILPTSMKPSLSSSSLALLREPLRLIGLGVRTVSFLSVKVYVAAFYVEPEALRQIQNVSGWESGVNQESLLATPQILKHGVDQSNEASHQVNSPSGEELMRHLLDQPFHFAIRIVPTRSTDFSHLRDGFCKSLMSRSKIASKAGLLSESESERIAQSITQLKTLFPTGVKVPKHTSLTLYKTGTSSLVVEYEDKVLGELKDDWIARELLLAYFANQSPISLPLKESVASGFEQLLKRQVDIVA